MAGASEIKSRIASVRETKKITDAMYMISSAKMQRARRELEEVTPYFEALAEKIGELLRCIPRTENRYFSAPEPDGTLPRARGLLLITADKGLAGAYNQEAIRVCEQQLAEHPQTLVFIVGEYGRQYFLRKGLPFATDFRYSAVRPTIPEARRICAELLEYYDDGRIDEIGVVYTNYRGAKAGDCRHITVLPLDRTRFDAANAADGSEKEFLPSTDAVLEGVVPSYLMGMIYGCLAKSYCSEQQSRMTAMKSAGDNAEDMLRRLQLQYNKIRQAAITNEMIEITAGVRALKRRRKSGDGTHE